MAAGAYFTCHAFCLSVQRSQAIAHPRLLRRESHHTMLAIICHGYPADPQISALPPVAETGLSGNPSTSAGRADGDMGIIKQGGREPASWWRSEVPFFLYEVDEDRQGAGIGYVRARLRT